MAFLNDDDGARAPGFPGTSPDLAVIERYFASMAAAATYPMAREIDPAVFAGSKWSVVRAIAHANGLRMEPFNVRLQLESGEVRDEYIPHLLERHGIAV